jgi:nucleotide-binding universal stress UspA family protein
MPDVDGEFFAYSRFKELFHVHRSMRRPMMEKCYKNILVPLDTSELAELALADALSVARLCHADVTLLHVITPLDKVFATDLGYTVYIDQQWSDQKRQALDYLENVYQRHDFGDLIVHKAVETGAPAETIIDFSGRTPIDLIVMATHGRSGLRRWVYGSVADKVLRGAYVPVLLVRAHPEPAA